jgi:aminopeptidase N
MSLYSIGSLFEPLKALAPFVFEVTLESMRFYEKFFGYPFAFKKYDQVFAHEYRWGAMENAGVVTFNDLYLFKEKVSTERMFAFSSTISHELSHHWFGNLVTMKWWDDLWLNEAFATFISYYCLEQLRGTLQTLPFESAMAAFFQRKGRGYHQDQMVTTHPIRCQVANTSVADSIFDGITYSKGAATMKQFFCLMGRDNFSQALARYFHKYEWKNATIDHFLAEMQHFFHIQGFSLADWKQMWLQTPSLNLLQAHWDPLSLHKTAKLTIRQSPYVQVHPTLRLHKIKVGLFRNNCEADVIEALVLPQEETVVEYDGSREYRAVLLNYEDHTFAKVIIDEVSLEFFKQNIWAIKDVLSRTLIWNSLWEMVRDARMTSRQFVEVVRTALPAEASDSIL